MLFNSVLPRLFEQVRKINLISATSVPAESIFIIDSVLIVYVLTVLIVYVLTVLKVYVLTVLIVFHSVLGTTD